MPAKKTMAQRLGQALETMTRQCGQLPETPAYGSWLLGRVSESPSRRWVRIKRIVTVYIMTANLTGIVVALLVVTFAFPVPSIYTDAPWWVTFGVAPAYATLALAIGTYWITTRIVRASIRWAIEERAPSQADGRNTLLLPFRVAAVHLILWDIGGALLATLYGLANRVFVTIILFSVTICGVLVATNCYLFTEFALRPVAAKALEAGRPPRRFAPGIMGRTMTVWSLGSGVPVTGIATTALYVLLVHNLTETQLASAVLILSITTLIFGFLVMWILAWLTAAPVRVVRAALKRVEQGDLRGDLVVFDGTELGELQRGFNAMVNGLRERERVRDLFGRHVGREVAGNVGAKQRFEYTVVGKPVNQAARLCELAKSHPARLLASSDTLHAASETERAHWSLGETVTLRGYHQPTQLASPHRRPPGSIHLTAEHAEEIRTDRLG
ncbi:adenylate cyclase [Mycobacterium tuberculosis]|nr:adenylate cyclase [Mycobacterium tuberculosis]